jgi:hypothetical protein
MDYQELDDIRFDEIYDYDNRELDEDEETEYCDNQYYFGLSTPLDLSTQEPMSYNNHLLFASAITINTFYQFPFDDVQTYLNNYRVIGPQNRMLVPEIMKMKFVDSEYNSPIYTVTNKTFWLRLIQRTWKKIYRKRNEFIRKNTVNMLRNREMGQRFILPNIQGMLSYLNDNKYRN